MNSKTDQHKLGEKNVDPPHSTGRASMMISLGILLSRILGLIRGKVFAHYLGNGVAAGCFYAALRIPNFLQNLLGEGVLSASFIPVYARLRAEGNEDLARRLAGVVGGALALGTSLPVLLGVIFTPSLIDLVAPGFQGEARELTISIVRILFPGVGLLVMSAWCLGILNSHRKFFLSYVAPVFWNLAMILTLVIFGGRTDASGLAIALAWGSVVGSLLQFGVQIPFVLRYGGRIRLSFDHRLSPARDVFKNFTPVLVSRGVVQLSAFIDGMIASFLGTMAVAAIGYAQTIYLLPISLFGMSVAAAELPEMSSQTADGAEALEKLRQRLISGLRRISFFVVPSTVALVLLGRFVISLLLQSGHFGFEDTLFVWMILIGSSVGLLASTWGRLYSSTFYALRDTRTPLKFAIARVSIAIALGLLFAFPGRPYLNLAIEALPGLRKPVLNGIDLALGAVGLTFATALAGWMECTLLKIGLEKKIGAIRIPRTFLTKLFFAAITSAIAAWALALSLPKQTAASPVGAFAAIGIYGLVYFFLANVFGIEELQPIMNRLKRLKRRP